jgi:NAD+ diphosphatase
MYRCKNGHSIYANPSPGVGLFLLDHSGMLLMAVRAKEPNKGLLDCFGGFIDGDESFEEALDREIEEELGLSSSEYSKPRYLTSATGTYEYEEEASLVISSIYVAQLSRNANPVANDDVAAIRKFTVGAVPLDEVGSNDVRHGLATLQKIVSAKEKLFD